MAADDVPVIPSEQSCAAQAPQSPWSHGHEVHLQVWQIPASVPFLPTCQQGTHAFWSSTAVPVGPFQRRHVQSLSREDKLAGLG